MSKLRPFIGPVQLRAVNFGVDTLLVNFKFAGENGQPNGDHLSESVAAQLDAWQQEARKEHKPVATPLLYQEKTLFIRPHGSGVWSWLLFNEDVTLSLSYGSMNGGVFCQARFASHLLWSLTPQQALTSLQAMLYDFTEERMSYVQASEIHLCKDIQGWYEGPLNWQEAFVTRVVNIRERPDEPTQREQEGGMSPKERRQLENEIRAQPVVTTTHRQVATLDFGSHGSEIMGQIYNKTLEIGKSQKTFFYDLWWANGWDGLSTIWRVEFRFRRKALASFELNDAYEVLASIALLWEYATQQWLRYVDLTATEDTNKSRLPADSVWQVVQAAGAQEVQAMPTIDPAREEELRFKFLLDRKPLQVLTQAVAIEMADRVAETDVLHVDGVQVLARPRQTPATFLQLAVSVMFLNALASQQQARVVANMKAVEETFAEEPPELVREVAREALAALTPSQVKRLVNHLSPEPFEEVRTHLVKRARRMAKKQACVASFAGYLTSLMALSYFEGVEYSTLNNTATGFQPSLEASLRVAFDAVKQYNKEKGRSHIDEVWKKRLAYGFVTAQQVEEERRRHGIDLTDDDWTKVRAELDSLKRQSRHSGATHRQVV